MLDQMVPVEKMSSEDMKNYTSKQVDFRNFLKSETSMTATKGNLFLN